MFSKWIDNINAAIAEKDGEGAPSPDAERVAAHMLIEVARSDFDIDDVELESITKAIAATSSLDVAEVEDIVAVVTDEVDQALSYHSHVKAINDTFNHAQKRQLIEQMWRVAYADSRLDRYEEAFIRKFCDLIYVPHKDFIQTKLKVTEGI